MRERSDWPVAVNELLARFSSSGDRETDSAWLRTRIPHIAEWAFLNILYKPVPKTLRSRSLNGMKLPNDLREFYRGFNGARLFHDYLIVFGFRDPAEPFDRENPLAVPTLSLFDVNSEKSRNLARLELICIGSYGFDQSLVCVSPVSGVLTCFQGDNFDVIRKTWPDFRTWVLPEVRRIALLHDDNGILQVKPEFTLPYTQAVH